MTWTADKSRSRQQLSLSLVAGLVPAAMLAIAAAHLQGHARSISIGVGVTLAVEGLFVFSRFGSKRSVGGLLTIAFYVVAAVVLRLNSPDMDWVGTHAMLAVSILVALVLIVRSELMGTSGNSRRVKFLVGQLLARKDWPPTFEEYKT